MPSTVFSRAYRLEDFLQKGKVLALYGARQVGKTTLLKSCLASTKLRYRFDSGENIIVQDTLRSSNFDRIKDYCEGYDLIVLDEAQNIPEVGKALKIIVDHVPGIQVLVTGSSSFDLSNRIGEPLVGRQRTLKLYPLSFYELGQQLSKFDLHQQLASFLIYGLYPEVVTITSNREKGQYLRELVSAYLLKDILALENVKSSSTLLDLLRMLAFQLGSEVSLNELANGLRIDVKTVGRYLDLLEKSFIIYSLSGFSRNLRSEITSKKKYYFYDNGVRNGIISSFNSLENRNDVGQLWENFIFMERIKFKTYTFLFSNDYFWRTYSKNEIDLIEEREGKIFGFEFKWKNERYKVPEEWRNNYKGNEVLLITPDNYWSFIAERNNQ